MKILCTYCAGRKRPGSRPLPAIRRYLSPRIAELHREARRRGSAWAFRIVSGRYGLLAPETPLPWYDHLLREDEVPAMAAEIAAALSRDRATHVEYHTADPFRLRQVAPYHQALVQACALSGIPVDVVLLPGDPD
ncbi:hypothetical protein KDM41_02455 [bacterium]|nr:hypothetical protein [bacterium]